MSITHLYKTSLGYTKVCLALEPQEHFVHQGSKTFGYCSSSSSAHGSISQRILDRADCQQAYQVGYSAALYVFLTHQATRFHSDTAITPKYGNMKADTSRADVLSHVQGSMSAGQTPDQTLARMLDWAEARQVRIISCFGPWIMAI
jgi:hypothetical protein